MKKKTGSLAAKLSLLTVLMVIVSSVGIGLLSYTLYRGDSISNSSVKALAIAQSVAGAIDGDQLKKAMDEGEKTKYWQQLNKDFDRIITDTDVTYLYAVDKNYTDEVTYVLTGLKSGDEPYADLGDKDGTDSFAEQLFTAIDSGDSLGSEAYYSEGYGTLVSGYAPILLDSGQIIGYVGVDILLNEILEETYAFGIKIIIVVVAFCILFGTLSFLYLSRRVGKPIRSLTETSRQLALGNLAVDVNVRANDEIGELATSFTQMIHNTKEQASALNTLANGDLTVRINPRSEQDTMSHSMLTMIAKLGEMFSKISGSTAHVTSGSSQIADGAQTLASSCSEQAAAVEEFSAALNDVKQKTESNARNARKSLEITQKAGSLMGESTAYMNNMLEAMHSIDESSQSINRIIKVIEDIAFQTNILALNAAVEAARAGSHGKGFAVVADEVRTLASKSAAAAKETSDLIISSSEKVREGNEIVEKTNQSLALVGESAMENLSVIQEIADSSEEQARAIAEITIGIEQISNAVQANSAVSEESAAASQEMNGQVRMLQGLVSQFKLN